MYTGYMDLSLHGPKVLIIADHRVSSYMYVTHVYVCVCVMCACVCVRIACVYVRVCVCMRVRACAYNVEFEILLGGRGH